jgi:hypothetical protein
MISMDNDEIRLIILFNYYNSLHQGEEEWDNPLNELKDVSESVINANLIYLIDKGLLRGKVEYTNIGSIPFVTRITDLGMDKVELIVKNSEKEDASLAEKLDQINSTSDRVLKFSETCLKIGSICKIAVENAHNIFSALN